MSLVGINFSVHKEGYRFIAIGGLVSFIFTFFSSFLACICVVLTLFCAFFFRNPKRVIPMNPDLIVSPADGVVTGIAHEIPPQELELEGEKRYRVTIFLSIFNVHMNRLPVSGKIKKVVYQPGSFLNAALEKSSIFNEKNTIVAELEGDSKSLVAFCQIAGMIARRIVCDVHEGQEIKKGEVFGLIRFGSRCDVWLPVGTIPQVIVGQTMIGGETVLTDVSIKKGTLREGTMI
ncbi:MAG: phosphatidylserine decarboxylase [Holosporales bacterium]|jgi:phosphatidylserine decarboxylase|nr:phosphatidylserine decarboxylase [Holosporales bacterium]